MFKKHSYAQNPGQELIQEMQEAADNAPYGISVRIELVTPELAGDLLATNFANNRTLRQPRVDSYAKQMESGHWTIAESAICFDQQGRLVNGQHRLTACIQANVPFLSVFMFGIDQAGILNLDTGYGRSMGQSLHILGISSATNIASIAEYISRWNARKTTAPHNQSGGSLMTRTERAAFVTENEADLREAFAWGMSVYRVTTANRTSASLCYLLFKEVGGKEQAEEFFTRLVEGTMLEEGSPILLLLKRLSTSGSSRKRSQYNPWEQVYITIKAWNMWRTGRYAKTLFWREDEGVPEPI